VALPDFKAITRDLLEATGPDGVVNLLEAAKQWDLAPVLEAGGALVFPHASIGTCGHQIAAVANACLDADCSVVLALGVLHALTPELADARARVADGGDPAAEPLRGVQGPGVESTAAHDHWRNEFSLDNFRFLVAAAARVRNVEPPQIVERFPFLVGDEPATLDGMAELERIVQDGAAVVATSDPVHHGLAYGDELDDALAFDAGGRELADRTIREGLALLATDDYTAWQQHCIAARNDARDVGIILRHLLGPLSGRIVDLTADDMTTAYDAPPPSWVATALMTLEPSALSSRPS
jgi:hypothetical protein